ncbi:MAG: zinc metallopeptidase [Chthoniobacteraceae bacterium]|nr:zinc metallopeptidase [Chthoniobacteraceae bacterium]
MFTNYIFLILIPMLLGLWAQARVKRAFEHYAQVPVATEKTGADVAREILAAANIHDVEVAEIDGMLGDHYDPTSKRLCLSSDVYNTPSVAAVGIAAHETGHAIQHASGYAPLQARMAVVPVTQFASQLLPFVIFGGFFFGMLGLIKLGILCYLVLTVFQLITLPVEFDASRRAKVILGQMGIIAPGEETDGVNRVLSAAALTYVAAFVAALGNLLYLLSIANRRND